MPPAHSPAHENGHPPPANRLISEMSPYLLQHAHNPVDWYPWGEEAFLRAARENKPVFLSIGYATCHWCHVMAHESFENPAIAAILNRDYVCIKVDREERPDIDSIYMGVCQLMTGHGGWPLSVFLMPDKKPFFAGTYYPPTGRFGMTGFSDLLSSITRLWTGQRETLLSSADKILSALESREDGQQAADLVDPSLIDAGYTALAAAFDPVNGGFGRAPKFPTPPMLLFLLRYHKRTKNNAALRMAETTLKAMRRGGICDQLGGGFHRYSVDERWLVPHFEKMLYDQALLLMVYTEAALLTRDPLYRRTAEEITGYILEELADGDGAFISAEDADSPGGEGAFYLWTSDEIISVLGEEDARLALQVYPLVIPGDPAGNVHSAKAGILTLAAERLPGTAGPDLRKIESIRSRLLAARAKRDRPSRDTKILADNNGLCIAALAMTYRAFGKRSALDAAGRAMTLILTRMRMPDGGLFHRYRDGEAAISGFADDYANVIRALLELYLSDFNLSWLREAIGFERYFREHFLDEKQGNFFSTADNAERLLIRKKEFYDGVVPSSNSAMLGNLAILSLLTGNPEYEKRADELARSFAGVARPAPSAYTGFLSALDLLVSPSTVVAIAGSQPWNLELPMVHELRQHYLPSVFVIRCPDPEPDLTRTRDELMPFLRDLAPINGKDAAYVCTGHRCSLPVTGIKDVLGLLGESE
nr:thioredoxin domain-containing protein [uncultured Methanoregula sp.]